jgi:hypothetical protein
MSKGEVPWRNSGDKVWLDAAGMVELIYLKPEWIAATNWCSLSAWQVPERKTPGKSRAFC